MGITVSQALSSIACFLTGRHKKSNLVDTEESTESTENHKDESNEFDEDDTYVKCSKCGHLMGSVNVAITDFVILHIYQCPECGSVSEFQYDNETNVLIRETHIYVSNTTNSGSFSEIYGNIPYENFSLDRLWAIGGHLCYPALVKSEFVDNDKSSLIFIKVDNNPSFNYMKGFYINKQNIIGEIKIIKSHNLSQFYNPYLANLPHKDFDYISAPTIRCESLESVFNIRYKHEVDGHTGIYVHTLKIIKDVPLKVHGLEVFVKFNSFDVEINDMPMSKLIKEIDLKSIVMGEPRIEVSEKFAVSTFRTTKYTLSSISISNIDRESRESFYEDIVAFFDKHDTALKGE